MMEETKTYQVATVEEYGYKNHKVLDMVWKIVMKVILVLAIFMLYLSIIIIFIQSINSSSIVSSFGHITFKWYAQMFSNASLTNSIVNTFIVSLSATALATILGTLIAVGINSLEAKRRRPIMLLNNIPLLNADIVTGITLMLVFSMLLPLFPYIFGWQTLILAHLFFTLPYVILSVLPKLREMDPNMMDAALDLGVRPFKALRKIIVPAIKSGIFAGMLLAFTMSFDDFVVSYYTTGNGFDNLSIWIYSSIGRKSLTPAVYAFSSLVTLVTIGVCVLLSVFKKNVKGHKKNEKKS